MLCERCGKELLVSKWDYYRKIVFCNNILCEYYRQPIDALHASTSSRQDNSTAKLKKWIQTR
jgi:hypothetical protein